MRRLPAIATQQATPGVSHWRNGVSWARFRMRKPLDAAHTQHIPI